MWEYFEILWCVPEIKRGCVPFRYRYMPSMASMQAPARVLMNAYLRMLQARRITYRNSMLVPNVTPIYARPNHGP